MPDLTALSPENIGLSIGVCLAAIIVGAAKYLRERKAPAEPKTADVLVAGGTIADMSPIRDIAKSTERLASAQERTADALDVIRQMLVERAQDQEREAEILRRAEMLAQQMVQQVRLQDDSGAMRTTRRRKPA